MGVAVIEFQERPVALEAGKVYVIELTEYASADQLRMFVEAVEEATGSRIMVLGPGVRLAREVTVMPEPNPCEAVQEGGTWFCHRCHLAWEADDENPPPCPLQQARRPVDAAEELRKLHTLVDQYRVALNEAFNLGREYEQGLSKG